MPQATDELRARWDIEDGPVWAYLKAKGFAEDRFVILRPSLEHELTDAETSAISFLIQEWDWDYDHNRVATTPEVKP